MFPKYQWREIDAAEPAVQAVAEAGGLPLALARILVARGVDTPNAARRFLSPDLNAHLGHPFDLPGARAAALRLWQAIRTQREIVIFGDFDADGVAAAAVLTRALQRLGGKAVAFLPERATEGYGLTFAALARLRRARGGRWPDLLVTVDCGITSIAEVAALQAEGVEVILTDHHEPGVGVPQGVMIVNPRVRATDGTEALCGAGVAFKIVHAMAELGKAEGWYDGAPFCGELLTAVGLATVTDMVPLTGENRILVAGALRTWKRHAGAGLRALLARAAARVPDTPDASLFGFVLGPRLNAAGRMGSAMSAYELLTTRDTQRAAELAAQLERYNGARRGVEARMLAAALRQCGLEQPGTTFKGAAVVVAGAGTHAGERGWHPGVLGIVAARLCDTTARPAAVVALDEQGEGRGSVRTCAGYHALEALEAAQPTLIGFGGHERAAGFTVKAGCLEAFREAFCAACDAQAARGVKTRDLLVDGWLDPGDLTLAMFDAQQRLAPFGFGNPAPRWGVRGATIETLRPVGAERDHLQLGVVLGNGAKVHGIWFRQGGAIDALRALSGSGRVDVVFELQRNDYAGTPQIELLVTDLASAAG